MHYVLIVLSSEKFNVPDRNRFGHGAFLVCLENLYKKITGQDLVYSALIGKPSEITYCHAERMVIKHARHIGITEPIKRLYAVG